MHKIPINHTASRESSRILLKLFDKVLNKWSHLDLVQRNNE